MLFSLNFTSKRFAQEEFIISKAHHFLHTLHKVCQRGMYHLQSSPKFEYILYNKIFKSKEIYFFTFASKSNIF